MDDVERAVDDGVNTFKVLTRVSTEASGGGARCRAQVQCTDSRARGGLPRAAGGKQSPALPEIVSCS